MCSRVAAKIWLRFHLDQRCYGSGPRMTTAMNHQGAVLYINTLTSEPHLESTSPSSKYTPTTTLPQASLAPLHIMFIPSPTNIQKIITANQKSEKKKSHSGPGHFKTRKRSTRSPCDQYPRVPSRSPAYDCSKSPARAPLCPEPLDHQSCRS